MIVKISESIINEALKPSEFRDLMKVGRELAMERISQIWPRLEAMADAKNRSGDRLYFDIEQSSESFKINSAYNIKIFLKNNGYELLDLKDGVVQKQDSKNKMRLGKVLTMLGKTDKTALELLQRYNNEKSLLANENDYLMVISKHPYDIGGMSTDRNWVSCMNLRGGSNSHYVKIDVKEGTIISYLIKRGDKNLQNPISRVLIKPFIDVLDETNILYGVESESVYYGRQNEDYIKNLISILDKAQGEKTGIFKISEKLYTDVSDSDTKIKGDLEKYTDYYYKNHGILKVNGECLKFVAEDYSDLHWYFSNSSAVSKILDHEIDFYYRYEYEDYMFDYISKENMKIIETILKEKSKGYDIDYSLEDDEDIKDAISSAYSSAQSSASENEAFKDVVEQFLHHFNYKELVWLENKLYGKYINCPKVADLISSDEEDENIEYNHPYYGYDANIDKDYFNEILKDNLT